MGDNVAALVRLMLVTDDRLMRGRDLLAVALAAERGGATSVQLRLKDCKPRELALLVRGLVLALKIPVLVNDRPDVAVAGGAAGVHLGSEDMPVELARQIVPAGFIIGASVGNPQEAAAAGAADYWGVGPWRETSTKTDAGSGLGAEGFRAIVALAGSIPCIAIGGVRPEDTAKIAAAGGAGVAVAGGILGAEEVEASTRKYVEAEQR
jgi:thiamine-phosphate pyrophosphorylase